MDPQDLGRRFNNALIGSKRRRPWIETFQKYRGVTTNHDGFAGLVLLAHFGSIQAVLDKFEFKPKLLPVEGASHLLPSTGVIFL